MSTRPTFEALRKVVAPRANTQPYQTPPTKVSGGFGVVPGAIADVDTSKPVVTPARISRADAQNIVQAELLGAVRGLMQNTTALTSQINRVGAKNGVIGTELVQFGAGGSLEVSRPVTIGSLCIHNVGSTPVIVQIGAGAAATAPNTGQGLHYVPAGAFIPIPIGQRGLVLYGTAGQLCNLQLFTGLQAYGVGL
jgi:hypothetical protein